MEKMTLQLGLWIGSPGMLHLPYAPFTPFMVLDEWHVVKKDLMVQI